MTRRMLIAALLLATLPAAAHEVSKGPNGGRVVEAGPYHVELVVETKAVAVYVSDAKEKPVPAAGFKGLAILTVSGKAQRIELAPQDNRLGGVSPVAIPDDVKGVVQLTGPDGLGSVPFITPIDGSVVVGTDSDRNHVAEIAMDFSKDDLRSLFTNLDKDMQATFTLSANILGGGSVRATVGMLVQPERKLVARIQPNPMNPVATVRVNLEQAERLTIRFYDMNGRLVRTLLEGVDTPAGVHDILFDGHGMNGQTLATGQYYYRASTPTAKTSGSVMILK